MSTSPRRRPWESVRSGAVVVAFATGLFAASGSSGAGASPLVTVTVTGAIENVVIDRATGAGSVAGSSVETFVEVDGMLYDLPDGTVLPDLSTGRDVSVELEATPGVTGKQALAQATDDLPGTVARVVEVLPVADASAPGGSLPTPDVVLGGHTLTVLPVYWPRPGVPDAGPDVSLPVLSDLAAQTAAYWSEQSAGRIAITLDVRTWVPIADPQSCSLATIYNAARAANSNVPIASPTHHVLVYSPNDRGCQFAGVGSLLGGMIWDNGYPHVDVPAHELGHNLGVMHANEATCTSGATRVPLSGTCTNLEYADTADVMGFARTLDSGNLNTALADYLGLANVTTIPAHLASPVVVDLAPLAQVSALRAVRINVPAVGEVYVDFRPNAGRDVRMPAWAGVQVHLRTPDLGYRGAPRTQLLDMQPTGRTAFAAPQLPAGASWDVPGTDLTVTVLRVGATARIQVAPTVTLDRYVTRVYRDLFGRAPDPQGLATWTTALRAGTPRDAVANSITYSTEYRSGLINGSYATYLGRAAEPAGLANWLGQMARAMTIEQMEGGFLASQEYYNQSGGDDAEWIRRLYGHVLGRSAGASEVSYWLARVRAPGSRYEVAMGFLISTEHLTTVVDGHYQHLLARSIDPSGRVTWVGAIQSGTRLEAIIGSIISSAEYWGRI